MPDAGRMDMIVPAGAAWGGNVAREDLPLPLCVLRGGALERNIARFQEFSDTSGVLLCPHAKTSMTPALFRRQLTAGCWGLTFATMTQVEVGRRHGVQRIFYANQLVGAADIRYVCGELRRDPGFEFYCLVDSVAGVELLAARVAAADPGRRVNVLVEGGLAGGRCGVRGGATAVSVAGGVRGRGLFSAGAAGSDGSPGEVLLSAGGSAFYDLVIGELSAARLSRPARVVLRSGCYLTQDWGIYDGLLADLHQRSGSAEPDLEPALEGGAQVASGPDPGRGDLRRPAARPASAQRLGRAGPRAGA